MAQIAIIGAGIAGLTLGRHAQAAGFACDIFDKGRGVGGRCATRRTEFGRFDHGLQLLHTQQIGTRLLLAMADLQPEQIEIGGEMLWRMPQGASSLAKALAADLDARLTTQISEIYNTPLGWRLVDHMGEDYGPYRWVVCALPPAQVQKLWPKGCTMPAALAQVKMAPCWAAMLALKQPLTLSNGAYPAQGFNWVASWDQGMRWIVHATPAFSMEILSVKPEEAAHFLWQKFADAFGVEAQGALMCQAHRWLYARTLVPAGMPYLLDVQNGLAACGDWCLGPDVGDAFESGAALAQALFSQEHAFGMSAS